MQVNLFIFLYILHFTYYFVLYYSIVIIFIRIFLGCGTNHLSFHYFLWGNSLWYTRALDYKHVFQNELCSQTKVLPYSDRLCQVLFLIYRRKEAFTGERIRNKEVSTEPRAGLAAGDWLNEYYSKTLLCEHNRPGNMLVIQSTCISKRISPEEWKLRWFIPQPKNIHIKMITIL